MYVVYALVFHHEVTKATEGKAHLLFVVVEGLEGGEDGRTSFTEVQPQVPVQTLPELHAWTEGQTGLELGKRA